MRTGHLINIIGMALYLVGATALPWQSFELAGLEVTGINTSIFGVLAALLAAVLALLSIVALKTGQRRVTAKVGLGLLAVLFLYVILSSLEAERGLSLMPYESISMGFGYILAVFGLMASVSGLALTLTTLPSWDVSTPLLRVLSIHKGEVVGDHVLYEPGEYATSKAFSGKYPDVDASMLPQFRVTSEGDSFVGFVASAAGKPGDVKLNKKSHSISAIATKGQKRDNVRFQAFAFGERGQVDLGETQIYFHFIEAVPGQSPAPLIQRTELGAFALLATVLLGFAFVAPIATWTEEAQREIPKQEPTCAGVIVQTPDEVVEQEVVEVVEPEAEEDYEEDVSKRAGGEEGKFGDPDIDPRVESKVPLMDGKMVEQIDPRNIGLTAVLNDNLGSMNAVAEVLRGDMAAMSSKLAVAMGGSGSEFVLGHGAGGMGFQGDGSGGGGDGAGRIMGMGDIDTGGGSGVKAGLGKKGKKRVGNLQLTGGTQKGFCNQSNIASVVKRRAAAIRACYEQRLQANPNLKGKITLRWTIDTSGEVKAAAAASDTMKDGAVTDCILRTVRRMRFRKPDGGQCVVQWPFVFSPG